ncbi:sigma-54 interaction domain-containing protein [Benzoatithermus flavus]|uniref:Sigma-54 dependent transcriptional regulator n=1 Tax=Benzoatithermus flavus TaxID=3108223 RepID=A0ABU8XTE7_9PROT
MRVLIVGAARPEIALAADAARERGAEVRHVPSFPAALDLLRQGQGADLLLVDADDEIDAAIARLAAERIFLPVVAYGIGCTPQRAAAAIKAGAREFLPFPPEPELIAAILEAVGESRQELVCADPRMTELLGLARRFAATDACVLVTGESGTGKEMLARFLHRHSRRAGGPFVAVNCAAVPESLLESELFGHEKGAFTGAVARRIGRFEEANGGTLLLDEISEMEPRLQAKLLRAIQEREIDRIGGRHPVKVDIRLIATSNRDLEQAVAEGTFRADLLFRLSVLTLELPPLRERPADIAALARHFATKLARLNGLPERPLSEDAIRRLTALPWRGNVRELENCLHRAVVLARGERIEAEDIHPTVGAGRQQEQPKATGLVGRTVAEVERSLIIDTLRHTLGNRTQAAGILGISIRTLRNKLRQYGGEGVPVPPPPTEHAA